MYHFRIIPVLKVRFSIYAWFVCICTAHPKWFTNYDINKWSLVSLQNCEKSCLFYHVLRIITSKDTLHSLFFMFFFFFNFRNKYPAAEYNQQYIWQKLMCQESIFPGKTHVSCIPASHQVCQFYFWYAKFMCIWNIVRY